MPAETKVETKHDWTAGARAVHYTATAGTLQIKDDEDKVNGVMFYVAYTEDGVAAGTRPVTFLYNGGPGVGELVAAHGVGGAGAGGDGEPEGNGAGAVWRGAESVQLAG